MQYHILIPVFTIFTFFVCLFVCFYFTFLFLLCSSRGPFYNLATMFNSTSLQYTFDYSISLQYTLLQYTIQKILTKLQERFQKQPPRGVLKKWCSENMQQIYRRTPMPKCDFNKVEITLRHGCSPVNLLHIFRTPCPRNTSKWLLVRFQNEGKK